MRASKKDITEKQLDIPAMATDNLTVGHGYFLSQLICQSINTTATRKQGFFHERSDD